jgi:serine/threonine-protein kinase
VDARSDLYALGCLLYAMLSGGPPFAADHPVAVLHQHLHRRPVSLRALCAGVPPDLDRLAGDLLAKDPAARPATADLVRRRLAAITGGSAAGPQEVGGEGAGPAAALAGAVEVGGTPSLAPSATRLEPLAEAGPPPERPLPGPRAGGAHRRRREPGRLGRWGHGRVAAVALPAAALAGTVFCAGWSEPPAGAPAPQAPPPAGPAAPALTLPAAPAPTPPAARFAAAVPQRVGAGAPAPEAGRDLRRGLEEIDRRSARGQTGKADGKRAEPGHKHAEFRRRGRPAVAWHDASGSI